MSKTIIGKVVIEANEELELLQKEYMQSLKGEKGNSEGFKKFVENKKRT
jgi:hypothetical protein